MSAPASSADAVHRAILLLLFFVSKASTAPRWLSSFLRQSVAFRSNSLRALMLRQAVHFASVTHILHNQVVTSKERETTNSAARTVGKGALKLISSPLIAQT